MERRNYFSPHFLIILILFSPVVSFAQTAPILEWEKSFGGSNSDHLNTIVQTNDGFLLGGESASSDGDKTTSLGFDDYWIVKIDNSGNKLWEKSFGGSSTDELNSIVQTSDGFLLGGLSTSSDGDISNPLGGRDYWIVKIDASGNKLWEKSFGGSDDDWLKAVVQTSDGFLLGGYSKSGDGDKTTSLGFDDYWIVKIDNSGNKLWEKSFGGSSTDELSSIVQTSDGFLLGGLSTSSDGDISNALGAEDYWIVKIDNSGNKLWEKSFGGSLSDRLTTITQISDGFLIGGHSSSNNGDISNPLGFADYWIVKIDNSGNKLWEKSFGGSSYDGLESIIQTDDGFLLGGLSVSPNGDRTNPLGNWDYWIVKIDATGNKQWEKSFGGSHEDRFEAVLETNDGFLLGGWSYSSDGDISNPQGDWDYWIVKTTPQLMGGVFDQDHDALTNLRTSLSGVNWDAIWPSGQPVDTWEGVVVANNRVIEINLPSKQLTGSIPASIGNLTSLKKLDLSNNLLTRGFPIELGNLINLEYFYAFNNQLIGSIPYSFGRLTKLKELDISRNGLTGTIPTSIGKLTDLTYLSFYNNQLSGSLPVSIKDLINLETLYLYNNKFSGSLLPSFFGLNKLKYIDLSDNLFSDIIPSDICNLTLLESFDIRNNYFTKLPDLSCLTNVTSLDIRDNILSFDDIIPNLGKPNFSYGSQRDQCNTTDKNLVKGQDYTFEIDIDPDLTTSTYKWFRDDLLIDTTPQRSYGLTSITEDIQGDWKAEITNAAVSGVTLTCTYGTLGLKSIPASEHNYILIENPIVEAQTEYQVDNLSKEEKNAHYDYFDGLSRLSQQVSVEASPAGYDLVQPIDYDPFGRQEKSYLSYASNATDGDFKPNAITEQEDFYDPLMSNADKIALDVDPYSESTFDGSPMNRVLTQTGPGEDWRTANRNTCFNYRTNTDAEQVRRWGYDFSTGKVESKLTPGLARQYSKGELSVTESTDEEDNKVLKYTDKLGRTVLSKVIGPNEDLLTYHIYDDFGNLRLTIPPKAWSTLQNRYTNTQDITLDGSQNNQDVVNELCYVYDYDERQRLIYQKVPGAQPYTMIYDSRDRLVLTQDGVQAAKATKEWTFTKYDGLNRPIITGIYKSNADRNTLISDINSAGTHEVSQSNAVGYSLNQSFPTTVTEADLLTITYYDNYDFKAYSGWDAEGLTYDYVADFVPASEIIDKPVNMPTGSKIKELDDILDGNETWYNTVSYYDGKYRLAQSIAENQFSETDRTTTQYDFSGKVTNSLRTHSSYTVTNLQIKQRYEYDHSERLIKVYHQVNTDPEILLASHEYNDLGELVDKKLHSEDNGTTFLQSVDYRYNIRGWLTHINNSALSDDSGATNDEEDDLFGMELLYNKDLLNEQSSYHPKSPLLPYPFFDQQLHPVLAGHANSQSSSFVNIKTGLSFYENNLWTSTDGKQLLPKATLLAEKLKNSLKEEEISFSTAYPLKKDESINQASTNLFWAGETVTSFTLINAITDQPIAQFDPLNDNAELNLANLPAALNIRANTSPTTVGSVVFSLTGTETQNRTESTAPYALFGDTSGDYGNWTPSTGSYTLTATPYDQSGGNGTAGTPLVIDFTVVNNSPLAEPDNLTANAISSTQIDLSWSDNATAETGYKIEYSTDGTNFTLLVTLNANATSYQNTGLSASTTYYYRVFAYDGSGNSGYSNTANATTGSGTSESVTSFTLIDAGTDQPIAQFDPLNDNAVLNLPALPATLNIRANTTPATVGSVVFSLTGAETQNHTESGGPYALFGDTSGDYANWTPAIGSYTLTATPYHQSGGNGIAGTPLTINFTVENTPLSVPGDPSGLSAIAMSSSQVNLTWADNATNEDGFKIEQSTDGTNFTTLVTLNANVTSYQNTGLLASTTYHYRVLAFNSLGNSNYSNVDDATTTAAGGGGNFVGLPPEADVYAHANKPNNNYGSDDKLVVRKNNGSYSRESFLRFDLSAQSGAVQTAKLKVYVTTPTDPVDHEVYFVSDDSWDEQVLTWNTKPSVSGSALDLKNVIASGIVEFDVTAQVQSEIDGDGKISLAIIAAQGVSPWVGYASREHATSSFHPTLEITYQGGGPDVDPLQLNSSTFKKQYNGNIAAVKWNTDGIHGTKEKSYAFGYEINRLKHAVYTARSTVGIGSWDADQGDFNVQDIAYDLNGNISQLTRFGNTAGPSGGNQLVIDQLSYQYGSSNLANQLIAVSDNAGADQGFKDGAASSAEYAYDENGNLIKDENKNITAITYNFLNLPQLITFGNGDEIRFVYDAVGNKTSKEVTSQGVTQVTYYVGGIQYTDPDINDAVGPQLDFMAHGEGRVKRKVDDSFVYQYDLRDHLGNVRLTFAAERVTDTYRLTMESELAQDEEDSLKFSNVFETRQIDQVFNATPAGVVANPNEVAYLNAKDNKTIGPAKSLAVRKGDRVTVSVKAQYDQSNTGTTFGNTSFLTALVGAFTGTGFVDGQTITTALADPNVFSSLELLTHDGGGVPFAHLNFMLFDENFVYQAGGAQRVSTAAATNHETLTLDITIPQRGYLFVYVSNESEWDVRAYFDELVINHEHLDVVQHDDYYPFGLAHDQNIQQERSNKYLYQGKERQFDLGLGWDDFHARQYDAALGRWHVMDPAGQFYSPYLAMGNNPVSVVDPDGELAWFVIPAIVGVVTGGINLAANWNKVDNFWQGAGYFGVGFVAGAGATLGATALAPVVTTATGLGLGTGFTGGVALGAIGGGIGGFTTGSGNTWLNGGNFLQGIESGLIGAGTGALLGGVTGGLFSGVRSALQGKNFWTGNNPWKLPQIAKLEVPKTSSDYGLPRSQLKHLPGQRPQPLNPVQLTDDFVEQSIRNTVDRNSSTLGHIFKKSTGHVNPSSIASQNRYISLFESVANNPSNLRTDAVAAGLIPPQAANNGVQVYTQTFARGQVWVFIRNGRIFDAGVNLLKDIR